MKVLNRDQMINKSSNGEYFIGKWIDKTKLAGKVIF